MKQIICSVFVGMFLLANHAFAGTDYYSGGEILLCNTKKALKKYNFPAVTRGCFVVETGPIQIKCVKSCMIGAKKAKIIAPTKTQIEGYKNDGLASLAYGRWPSSNTRISNYYGKEFWYRTCFGRCNYY